MKICAEEGRPATIGAEQGGGVGRTNNKTVRVSKKIGIVSLCDKRR